MWPFHFNWSSTFGSLTYKLSVAIETIRGESNLCEATTNYGSANSKMNCSAPTISEQLKKIMADETEIIKIRITGHKKDVWYPDPLHNEEDQWVSDFTSKEVIAVITAI
ncbi:MAG: hypothetical protein PHY72_01130 [Candidatus Pacebacteria bacterium]|nr:hypothetical protein [Candidatus Paceibacterota bacterium]